MISKHNDFFSSRDIVANTNPKHTFQLSRNLVSTFGSRMPRMCKDILFLFRTWYGEVPGDYLREASLKDTRECDRFARYFRRH